MPMILSTSNKQCYLCSRLDTSSVRVRNFGMHRFWNNLWSQSQFERSNSSYGKPDCSSIRIVALDDQHVDSGTFRNVSTGQHIQQNRGAGPTHRYVQAGMIILSFFFVLQFSVCVA